MKILAALCACFLLLIGTASAAVIKNQSSADSAYLEMVRQARIMPKNFDFVALRKAYVETSFYSPEGVEAYKIDLLKALDKVRAGKLEGQRELDTLLNHHFAHYAIHLYLNEASDPTNPIRVQGINPDLHKWALKGILPSILCNQAGLIPEKSINVIDVGEEYFIAQWHFRATVQSRSQLKYDGHSYDVLTMMRNGHHAKIHFNIDIPKSYGMIAAQLTQK